MVEEKLIGILSEILDKELSVEGLRGVNLIEEYSINSLDALQIIIEIEKRCNVIIDDEEKIIEAFRSFESLAEYVKECMTGEHA